jgi:hypothetical protein
MKTKLLITLVLLVLFGLSLGRAQSSSLPSDLALLSYPQGYTKVLIADLKFISSQISYKTALLEPLRAARHPLNGIVQTLELVKADINTIAYVAHGTGADLTGFSLIENIPFATTFGALQGLKFAAGAPNSPYTHWSLENIQNTPVIFTGGNFGPTKIEWAYIPLVNRLWIGTETAFTGEANKRRLRESTEKIIARQLGQISYFDEWASAIAAQDGQIGFVRKSDNARDKLLEPDEEAMSFAIRLDQDKAWVRFFVRFQSVEAASQALVRLRSGQTSYLAQDLYQGQLQSAQQSDRFLALEVLTTLRGVVGLLVLAMPS